jgi:hypothetical protein
VNVRLGNLFWLAGLGLLAYRLLFVGARRLAVEAGGEIVDG